MLSHTRWLVPPKPKKPHTLWQALKARAVPSQCSVPYIRNNAQFILFSIIVAVVNVALFVARCVEYKDFKMWDGVNVNYWIMFAKASGTKSTTFKKHFNIHQNTVVSQLLKAEFFIFEVFHYLQFLLLIIVALLLFLAKNFSILLIWNLLCLFKLIVRIFYHTLYM